MCKKYVAETSFEEKKLSMMAPVNQRMLVPKNVYDGMDELDEMEFHLEISLGRKMIKNCPFCSQEFKSEHAYQLHIREHKPKCQKCSIKLKSWKNYEKHRFSCPRRVEIKKIERTPDEKVKTKRQFKCQLCQRRYKNETDLRNHHINRCEKRYITPAWTVKI